MPSLDSPHQVWWKKLDCSLPPYALMILAAVSLRMAQVLTYHTYIFSEYNHGFSFGYETGSIARSLAEGHGFSSPFGVPTGPTAWIAPLYPFLCSIVFRIFGIFSDMSGFVILLINGFFS